MRTFKVILVAMATIITGCNSPGPTITDYSAASQVESGSPVSVMLTSYSTTLVADGKDFTHLRIAVTDSAGMEIKSATDTIRIYVAGDGYITDPGGSGIEEKVDTSGTAFFPCILQEGICNLIFRAGTTPGRVKIDARSGRLWPGGHEIHTLPPDFPMMTPSPDQLPETVKNIDRMIGADISFLPEIESRGTSFKENGQDTDAIELLRNHGFNYIRLRIFVNPENEKGYSPATGFCGLSYTIAMARRVKEAGMKLLLDFHYSDYWADPQQQNKPLAWSDIGYEDLKDSVRTYTSRVLHRLEKEGVLPDMVQVGNEINHGILWPEGHISNPEMLAGLLIAGVEGIEDVAPDMPVMMHIALGGQNDEAVFWLDNMLARGVRFDILGLSYYPRWHGTLNDLNSNMNDLIERYKKPVNVVEYSDFKKEVHDIVFNLPGEMGKGACIWEPLGWRSGLFERNGEVTSLIYVYDGLNEKYLK